MIERSLAVIGLFVGVLSPLQAQEIDSVQAVDSLSSKWEDPFVPVVSMDTFSMDGELELRTSENLDSLLNLWYVNQSLESAVDDYDPEADTLMPDFSDSVYMQRLAEIPTVVDLTYNRIVKNYINMYSRKRREQVEADRSLPADQQLSPLIQDLLLVSSRDSGLSEQTRKFLAGLKEPVYLQVFVTPT